MKKTGILELSRNNDHEGLERLRAILYKPDSLPPSAPSPPVGRSNDFNHSPTANGEYAPYYPLSHSYNALPQGCFFAL